LPLRATFIYQGTVAEHHGGRRILEQMAWLAAEGCDVSLAPIMTSGDPEPELSPAIDRHGIRLLDPVRTRRRRPVKLSRPLPSVAGQCTNLPHVARIARASDWVVVGNTWHAASTEVTATIRCGRAAISWDGDAVSRWYTTYARWLQGQNRVRALSRLISAFSAGLLERRLTQEYDFVTVPGPADVTSVRRHARRAKPILMIPNVVRIGQGQPKQRPMPASRDALFVGSTHGPNVDGLRWLLADVWPAVQEQSPGARLTVVGRGLGSSATFGESFPRAGVEFVERIDDLDQLYLSAKVVLVPIFYGSGVPNKVLEALATDSAVVLTPYVVDALGRPPGLFAHEGASAWVDAVIEAFADPRLARVDPTVRETLLAVHGPEGFDRAMRDAVDRVRVCS